MPELVIDGETGLLVPPREPAALAAAVLRARSPTRRRAQAMARAGRKRVEAHFSLRAKLDATEALYRRLVASGARVRHAVVGLYRRLLPLHAALPARAGPRRRRWPWSSRPWRAPSRGW